MEKQDGVMFHQGVPSMEKKEELVDGGHLLVILNDMQNV